MEHNRMLEGIENHSVLGMISDRLPASINLDLPYNILLPGRDEWERNRIELLRADSCWYTNGSKTPEGAGAGAEIHANEPCGRELEKRSPNCRSTKIFSDSQAALKVLGSYRYTPKSVWNCQQTLIRIPGHVGLKGNEMAARMADSLARREAASGQLLGSGQRVRAKVNFCQWIWTNTRPARLSTS
ncbi:hypothetical protein NQ315_000110 [Exocentrus adspersus]|uniref:RNase H type-1 domain-containing protein n=1 Tax=Exocentrus adspersus TaxID=1586481 RepID=A0AAV8VTF5_9CUCU|nr:hypothetical protein NQ315_000110 [Exocentrus adspersus]